MRLWYVNTAVHLWRFYFRYLDADPDSFFKPDRLNWQACDRAIKKFTEPEKELLRQYYLTSYGNYEDVSVIQDFFFKNDCEKFSAWGTIKRANYEVAIERGLMARKEEKAGYVYVNRSNVEQSKPDKEGSEKGM